jgi:hypothetical protein
MRKYILLFILINLYSFCLQAQNKEEALNAIKLVQRDIQEVINHKPIAKSCKTQIADYGKALSAIQPQGLNATGINKYIIANTSFIQLTSANNFSNLCKDNIIIKLVSDVQASTSALKGLLRASKPDTIQLSFHIADVANKTIKVSKVKLDTANGVSSKTIVDAAGNLKISLFPGSSDNKNAEDSAGKLAPDKDAAYTIHIAPLAIPAGKSQSNLIQKHPALFTTLFLVCVALIIGLLIVILVLSRRKGRIQTLPVLENKQEEVEKQQEQLKKAPSLYFDFEALLTAGPRKKPIDGQMFDADLGEDACGFVLKNEQVLFWLLDGTSDKDDIRNPANHQSYFSSRLLAQSIAGRLKSVIKPGTTEPIDELVLMIADQVKDNWLSYINALPDVEKSLLVVAIKQSKFLECATTIIISQVSLNGQLTVYRSGDSKLFVYTGEGGRLKLLKSPLATKHDESNDRLFFRLLVNSDNTFNIVFNHPLFEILHLQNVQTVIACSDGVGKLTEEALQYQYPDNPDKLRAEITKQVQATADDKSLCILNIKESSTLD